MPSRPHQSESASQRALILWWHLAHRGLGVPWERLLYAVPNGGARDPRTGAIMKAEGVRAGAPDLNLDVARGGYFGMRIEMKTASGRVREVQSEFHAILTGQGYHVVLCRSWDEARREIESYLRLPATVGATNQHQMKEAA